MDCGLATSGVTTLFYVWNALPESQYGNSHANNLQVWMLCGIHSCRFCTLACLVCNYRETVVIHTLGPRAICHRLCITKGLIYNFIFEEDDV